MTTAQWAPILGTFLAIAEAARSFVLPALHASRKTPSNRTLAEPSGVQHLVAELEIELSVCRAVLERTARSWDTHLRSRSVADMTLDDLNELTKDYQCAKTIVNRKAITFVDLAMTMVGGRAYTNSCPLSRAYRDVRAGPFMQPNSPVEVFEYIGKGTLGLPLELDL